MNKTEIGATSRTQTIESAKDGGLSFISDRRTDLFGQFLISELLANSTIFVNPVYWPAPGLRHFALDSSSHAARVASRHAKMISRLLFYTRNSCPLLSSACWPIFAANSLLCVATINAA